MPTVPELQARLDTLRQARAWGVRSLRLSDGREVVYRDDGELGAAIADVERQLAAATGTPAHTIRLSSTKGLEP